MSTHHTDGGQEIKSGFYSDLRQYVFTYNILAIATGWGIGSATKDLIARLIDDIFIPVLTATIGQKKIHAFVATLQTTSVGNAVHIACSVALDFLVWILIILLTFALLEYVLYRGFLGLRTKIKPTDIPMFESCQVHSHFHIPQQGDTKTNLD